MTDDNVVPIAPTDPPCASCGAVVRAANRFQLDQHQEGCMQPEIRFRRAERNLAQLKEVVYQLVASNNDTVTNQIDLNARLKAQADRIAVLEGCIMTGAWAHRTFPDAVLDERQREVKAQMDEARRRLA